MIDCPTPTKAKYRTRKAAKAAAKRMRELHGNTRGRMHAFQCDCGFYHVGTLPPWVTKGVGTRGDLDKDAA